MVKRKNILDLKLIEAVARRPQLYDKTHTEYSHQNKKTRIWRDIAAEVGFEDGERASKRWKGIRDCYASSNKRRLTGSEDGEASPYIYFEELSFLRTALADRSGYTSSPLKSQPSTINTKAPSCEEYAMKYPKFRGEPLKLERNEDNDDLLFGKRVANFLGKLPGTRKRRACIDIEQVMLQYEEEIECDG